MKSDRDILFLPGSVKHLNGARQYSPVTDVTVGSVNIMEVLGFWILFS